MANAVPTPTTHVVSLSRLHKLIERVRTKIAELHAVVSSSLQSVNLNTPMQPELDALAAKAKTGIAAREQAEALSRELAKLRSIVATENARLGINELLAAQDVLGKHLAVLKAAVADGETAYVVVGDVSAGDKLGDFGRKVSNLSREDLATLKTQAEALQNELYALSDQVAERNATRVTLNGLSTDVAKFLAA